MPRKTYKPRETFLPKNTGRWGLKRGTYRDYCLIVPKLKESIQDIIMVPFNYRPETGTYAIKLSDKSKGEGSADIWRQITIHHVDTPDPAIREEEEHQVKLDINRPVNDSDE